MDELLEQIEGALDRDLYLVALFAALSLPDICGALEAPDGEADRPRYTAWFDHWVAPDYSGSLNGDGCYYYRCAMLHQARPAHPRLGYSRIIFAEPSGHVLHNNILNDALNIDVRVFCKGLVASVRRWQLTVQGTEPFETNAAQMFRRHPSGLSPYIRGIAVIG